MFSCCRFSSRPPSLAEMAVAKQKSDIIIRWTFYCDDWKSFEFKKKESSSKWTKKRKEKMCTCYKFTDNYKKVKYLSWTKCCKYLLSVCFSDLDPNSLEIVVTSARDSIRNLKQVNIWISCDVECIKEVKTIEFSWKDLAIIALCTNNLVTVDFRKYCSICS